MSGHARGGSSAIDTEGVPLGWGPGCPRAAARPGLVTRVLATALDVSYGLTTTSTHPVDVTRRITSRG
ncbi:MAG: hypothetical protein ACODAG_10465, partial [Myxococcota bacterium]